MKHYKPILLAGLLATLGSAPLAWGQGTAFTYQGQLTDNGIPAQGAYDLRFRLYDDGAAGSQVGADVTVAPVTVSSGLFSVPLDFGALAFDGAARWLEISARTNGALSYTMLAPRQPLLPTPYAIYAQNAARASTAASMPWSSLTGVPPAFADGVDNDTLYGAGAGLTLSGTTFSLSTAFTDARYWTLNGNAGTNPSTNFLGTTDNQALEIKVNGLRALRFEPSTEGAPNLIGGSPENSVAPGLGGATIAGGGVKRFILGQSQPNSISAGFATIGGGTANAIQAASSDATISGGSDNRIQTRAEAATIGGGTLNSIQTDAFCSTIGGGYGNEMRADAWYGTIGGGLFNAIQDQSESATIGGGRDNTIKTNAASATIGGGTLNTILTGAEQSLIGGGQGNTIQTNSPYSTIGGGGDNTIQADAPDATIAGGAYNTIETNAFDAAISGGLYNTIQAHASDSTIGGGRNNIIRANAQYAAIPGGRYNEAGGDWSFAAGRRAKALHNGSFVWGDTTNADVESTEPDQFTIRASNGVRLTQNAGGLKTISVGEHYRDNAVVAWGRVAADGTVQAEFGVTSVAHPSAGVYDITVNAIAASSFNLIPVAMAEVEAAPTSAATARIVSVNVTGPSTFTVYINNGSFASVNNDFHFLVTAR